MISDLSCRSNARQVDLRDKRNFGRNVGILLSAVNLEAVDPVFVNALDSVSKYEAIDGLTTHVGRPENGPVPVGHEKVLAVFQTVRACLYLGQHTGGQFSLIHIRTCAQAFLAFLQLL